MAAESIIKREGKKVYLRRDGRVFERGEIPVKRDDFAMMMKELKQVGRFPDLLKHLPV